MSGVWVGRGRLEEIAFWSIAGFAVGMLVLLGGIVVGLVPVDETGADRVSETANPQVAPPVRPATTAAPVATTTTSDEPPQIVVRAVAGECWVEAREGSAEGRVLYTGLLARGQEQRLTARQVWLRLGAGQNVVVTAGGRRMPVPSGTGDMIVRV